MATTTAIAARIASPRATKPRHGWFSRAGRSESGGCTAVVTESSLMRRRQQRAQRGSKRLRIPGPRDDNRAVGQPQRHFSELLRDRPATTQYPGADRGTDIIQLGDDVHAQRLQTLIQR